MQRIGRETLNHITSAVSTGAYSGNPFVLYFGAPWCGMCKSMKPVLESLDVKYPNVDIHHFEFGDNLDEIKSDIDECIARLVPDTLTSLPFLIYVPKRTCDVPSEKEKPTTSHFLMQTMLEKRIQSLV